MPRREKFDVIVIGVGSMGSAACWFLSGRGYKVLGIEQFGISHERGSHTGQSRIIRKAYFEHPDYVPLLKRAYENWKALESETGSKIYHETGIVYFGPRDHETMDGVRRAARMHDIAVREFPAAESTLKFPQFRIPPHFQTLFEPESGFLTPDAAINAFVKHAIRRGSVILTDERVSRWRNSGGEIEVVTPSGSFVADRLIITAGSWTSKLLPELNSLLRVTRQLLAWVEPKKPEMFSMGRLPCWFVEDAEAGMLYGFPMLDQSFGAPYGMKVALHVPGESWEPDIFTKDEWAKERDQLRHLLNKYLPDAGGKIVDMKSCLYTYSPDTNFIIDQVPGFDGRVTVACGFSGHGFKFSSVIGEILADLAVDGKTDLPIDFLRLNRFNKSAAK
ncbi:MAG TPA: N-methyl-L-tryptophan oxidase [Chryseosolibacter sp.]|nr:N-methyl-L-tryptophan oxidase [Chryseosolibacter sp.]